MFVVTADQQGSRRSTDQVPALLAGLPDLSGMLLPFERTVGDEVQAVLDDPVSVVEVTLHLLRLGGWSVGIGAGPVLEPLPASTREASGPAFIAAREAVEAAKNRGRPVPVAVRGAAPAAARDAEAVLTLLGTVLVRRSPAGWAAVDAARDALGRTGADGPVQQLAAERLGISQQAVSQRLRAAHWAEEQAVRPVLARLLAAAGLPEPAEGDVGADG
ncbi:hypothetical protein [Cellulomonas sp. NTE-D12]|uniref:hypothetical protein n=1 Tax=Cellulomonas sp. NTE-D12 TaxID=2962632 RepID=UPI0030813703|nr:hypothetical protein CELD12_18330 [Cellulomonas sp. NTE-D12]